MIRIQKNDDSGEWKQIQSICLFRKGIRPAWEDPVNAKGSDFRVTFIDRKPHEVDQYWENLVFKMIGEDFINSEAVSHPFPSCLTLD